MIHKIVLDKIVDLEKNFPFKQLKYENTEVWFVIRAILFQSLINDTFKKTHQDVSYFFRRNIKSILTNIFYIIVDF